MLSKWFAGQFESAGETLNFLCGAEQGRLSIYSAAFLVLFAAKIWGVLAWPWWAVFTPLVAAPLIALIWWVALLLVELCVSIVRAPLDALARWAARVLDRRAIGDRRRSI